VTGISESGAPAGKYSFRRLKRWNCDAGLHECSCPGEIFALVTVHVEPAGRAGPNARSWPEVQERELFLEIVVCSWTTSLHDGRLCRLRAGSMKTGVSVLAAAHTTEAKFKSRSNPGSIKSNNTSQKARRLPEDKPSTGLCGDPNGRPFTRAAQAGGETKDLLARLRTIKIRTRSPMERNIPVFTR